GAPRQGNYIRYHKVKPGETLKSLSQEYYGDSRHWDAIYKMNEDKIEKGLLKPGQTLIIP
ncbi:MAG TPA: LysM domain-containing protein, partial [bacterium]|nr:LysM domain-containing protein [bacterium]